jgi:hypothetical protein
MAAAGAAMLAMGGMIAADDDVSDLFGAAKPAASAPTKVTAPDAPENKPTSDALGTLKDKAPAGSRDGKVTLSNGVKIDGRIWTTQATPLRVWIEENKTYKDIDFAVVKQIDVHVITEVMEDDWRWLKEGSDQKVYSGKKYPNVDLAYKFTLVNGQEVEGTVVAPIYVVDGSKARTLALYKHYKGNLDETLKDLVYITAVTLEPASAAEKEREGKMTRKLPLLDD